MASFRNDSDPFDTPGLFKRIAEAQARYHQPNAHLNQSSFSSAQNHYPAPNHFDLTLAGGHGSSGSQVGSHWQPGNQTFNLQRDSASALSQTSKTQEYGIPTLPQYASYHQSSGAVQGQSQQEWRSLASQWTFSSQNSSSQAPLQHLTESRGTDPTISHFNGIPGGQALHAGSKSVAVPPTVQSSSQNHTLIKQGSSTPLLSHDVPRNTLREDHCAITEWKAGLRYVTRLLAHDVTLPGKIANVRF